MSENLHRGEEPAKPAARRRWRVCILAIMALLIMAAGIGVVLMESTSNDTPQKRVRALVAKIERRYSDDWLSKLLREYFPEYNEGCDRDVVAGAMIALGVEAVPEIIKATKHKLPSVRYAAAIALDEIGDPSAVSLLVDLLAQDSDSDIRGTAAFVLGRHGGPEATASLIEAMATPDLIVRSWVVEALGDVGGPKATARLIEAMADSDSVIRYGVASALGKVGGPKATARLIEAMADPDPKVREAVAEALGEAGVKSVGQSPPQAANAP
jgi:hypothetical protein